MQFGGDFSDGPVAVNQFIGGFFHAEIHGIIKKAQPGKLVDDAVDVVPAVVELPRELAAGDAAVFLLNKVADAGKNQDV